MRIIGLTGGIASGKSTVSQFIQEKGMPVICADKLAREVVEPGKPAYQKIVQEFGGKILHPDKTINRPRLAALVFSSPEKLKKLNSLIHPHVVSGMKKEIKRFKNKNQKMVVLDIPLLFEEKLDKLCDEVVVVYIPEKIQRERLKKRDALSEEEISIRILSQMPLAEKLRRAHTIIDNSGGLIETKKQVEKFFQRLQKNEN